MEEKEKKALNGWIVFPFMVASIIAGLLLLINFIILEGSTWSLAGIIFFALLGYFLQKGLITLQPNEAWVLILLESTQEPSVKMVFTGQILLPSIKEDLRLNKTVRVKPLDLE